MSFRLGLVHFFATLLFKLKGDDGVDAATRHEDLNEDCLIVMDSLFPPELSTKQLTNLVTKA